MRYAFAVLLALSLALSACGGDAYNAPPTGNGYKAGNGPAGTTTPGKTPTGPSQANEYDKAARAAFAAQTTFKNDKTAENFAKWGAHMYDALRYSIVHDRNGHSSAKLYNLTQLKQMRTDFTKTFGPTGWEENADYKAAKKSYDEVQQQTE